LAKESKERGNQKVFYFPT